MARTLGSRIRAARERAGLSQPALGRKLNKCTSTVHRWETDRCEPSVSTLKHVAAVLRVSVAELVGGAAHAA
jgi:transcriptional regulator with XRE-family HTH domain